MLKRFDGRRQARIAWWLLLVVTLTYILEMGHQALLRYDTFKATAFDLGNMDQVLWNTIHGRLFQFTNQAVDWYGPPTRLAVHFEPILLPLSLLYAYHADPRILLVFQTLALASGVLPVFLLTRTYLPEWPILASLMATAYLLSPAVLGLNIFDFHPIALATPLLLYAVLALTYKRYGWFILACILAASCKEDIPLTVAMLGLFLIWRYKLPRLGIALTLGSILWSALAFGVIIPHFYPGAQHNNFWYRYESLGSSPADAIINVVLHPWLLFTTFITLDRVYYLASLLRSTGFLGVLAPEWLLLALPGLAENILSTDPLLYSGAYHYNAAIIPFVMLSAIHGTRRFIMLWRRWRGEPPIYTAQEDMQEDKTPPSKVDAALTTLAHPIAIRLGLSHINSVLMARLHGLWQRISVSKIAGFAVGTRKSLVTWLTIQWRRFSDRMEPLAREMSVTRLQWIAFVWITLMIGLNYMLATPVLSSFWADHEPGSREQHIQQLLAMIPPDASISAGSNINPHVSERQHLAVFPSISDTGNDTTDTVQYIIVDLNAVFPEDRARITNELDHLVRSGQYREIARAQGVVLLVRRSATG
ncbi:MAG: DUF2079 domain-containing protein [Ktedonobacteraceae bacterium]